MDKILQIIFLVNFWPARYYNRKCVRQPENANPTKTKQVHAILHCERSQAQCHAKIAYFRDPYLDRVTNPKSYAMPLTLIRVKPEIPAQLRAVACTSQNNKLPVKS